MAEKTAETFRAEAFDKVAECRQSLTEGRANLSGLEQCVRNYCTAIAALSKEEGRSHESALQELMQEIGALEAELTAARDAVYNELKSLGRLKQANVAYHKTDFIGPIHRSKKDEQ